MLPIKRTLEENKTIENFVRLWNDRFPKFRIVSDNIIKPSPKFLVKALLEMFDALGLDTEAIIEFTCDECQEGECSDGLKELLPILNLTEALNTLFHCLSPEFPKITIFSFLQPTQGSTLQYLRFLLNFVIFVNEREDERAESVEQVENEARQLEGFKEEVDNLMDELNKHHAEGADREQRIKQLQEKIERLNIEPIELGEMIEKLSGEMQMAQEHGAQLLDMQETLHKHQVDLQQQITRLRASVVTKSDQTEVLKNKELAIQKEEEASKLKQEVSEYAWEREKAIRMLTNNMQFISDVTADLNGMQALFSKIQEVEKSNIGWIEGESELNEVRGNCEELQRRIHELKAADKAWEEDNKKAEMEVHNELETAMRDDKLTEAEYESCLNITGEQKEIVDKIKMSTVQYNREREHLINKYTKIIPQEFDDDIDTKIEKIKNIINNTLGQKLRKI